MNPRIFEALGANVSFEADLKDSGGADDHSEIAAVNTDLEDERLLLRQHSAASSGRPAFKTVHLVNAWQSSGGGGISTFYNALLGQARNAGEEMVLVAPGESDTCRHEGSTRIYTVKSPVTPFNAKYRMIMPTAWPGVNRQVLEILRHEKPELLDICDKYSLHYFAGLMRKGWIKGVPRPVLVGTSCERMDENMAYYGSTSQLARRFCRWYLKWNYFGYFDHHITVSDHTALELRDAARGHIRGRGVWVKPMGAACSNFSPRHRGDQARKRLEWRVDANGESRLVVYAGRLVPEKNLPLLLDVFGQLHRGAQDYRLVIAGDGILREPLEREAQTRFGADAAFLGHIQPADLPELLANADVFVHPNPREPFGIAPLEAMASGLPLVACDSGGVLSYANPQNAWLSEPTASAMASAVDSVFADAALRQRKVDAALATARDHDWPRVANAFRQLYADLATGVASGAAFESTRGNWLGAEV